MLGLVALQADIDFVDQYESVKYFCRFSEDGPLTSYSQKKYTYESMTIDAIMLPLTKTNEQFQTHRLVIYSDWDILQANGAMGLPQTSYDFFHF